MKQFLILALLVTLSVSCNSKNKKSAKAFAADFAAANAQLGSPMGATFVKLGKDNKNYAVIKVADGANTVYIALDVKGYKGGKTLTEMQEFVMTHQIYVNLTANGNGTYSCGAGCFGTLGGGTSMVFETTEASARDLETAAAAAEEYALVKTAENLSEKFALSTERSFEVAGMINQWNKISKNRAMTDADADAFALDLIGSSAADVQDAFKRSLEGDASDLNALIDRAADVNGISSENMNKIVSELFL